MGKITELAVAVEEINVLKIEALLNDLDGHQLSGDDRSDIEILKRSIDNLMDHADENGDLFNVEKRIIPPHDINYIINKNQLFMKLIQLPFINDDVYYLQKLFYRAYATQNSSIHCMLMGELFKHYQSSVNFTAEDVKPQNYDMPKVFHYIWAGKTIPEHLVPNVVGMLAAAKKSGYKVCLWTDDPSKQEAIFNLIPASYKKYLEIKNISDLEPKIDAIFDYDLPEFKTKAANVIKGFIQQEMSGFKNYAALSDLLRIIILLTEGGTYLDIDVNLSFDSSRDIGEVDTQFGFKQLMRIWESMPGTPESLIIQERNDMLMSSPNHPILREAMKIWFQLLLEERSHVLPHAAESKSGFVPTMADQRRFGQSHYEYLSEKDPMKGQFKPKELGTGNLGVIPISIAVQEFIKQYNLANQSDKTQKDFAFGYNRSTGFKNGEYYSNNKIHFGNLVFDHIMEHAWLSKIKRKPIDV